MGLIPQEQEKKKLQKPSENTFCLYNVINLQLKLHYTLLIKGKKQH